MKVIYKYPFVAERMTVPLGKIVLVDRQLQPTPVVWVEQEIDEQRTQELQFIGTGHHFDDHDAEHVGSVICGQFVWHVYRRTK